MKRALLLVAGEVLLILGAFVLFLVPKDSTMYAAGFSESEYRDVRTGDSMSVVELKLGPPLYRVEDATCTWGYALSLGGGYCRREVIFDDKGKVVRKHCPRISD